MRHAAHILSQGGIIAYPTEAVFGLGCLADNTQAINRLLKLKHRPVDKGLILLASEFSQFEPYIDSVDDNILRKIQTSWPGSTTWIVPAPAQTSSLIRGQFHSVAVRISAHPVVMALCRQCRSPLISTSANISGQNMTYCTADVRLQFDNQLDYILDAPLGGNDKPSIIKDALTDQIIRS
ncbi:MAG: threonylcarbamoyl-AMP synthase [gamma proteobacterium symbiont of Taylorina sp.]|nr:threonylcarbamoyl-AMP synthase [gamma proteobacterium symbiont of Taylorina sp.]